MQILDFPSLSKRERGQIIQMEEFALELVASVGEIKV